MLQSSTESEYRSLAHTIAKLAWICHLLQDLHVPLLRSPILDCDKISALAIAHNLILHARTKHTEVDYHFVGEQVTFKLLLLSYVCTEDQIVDIFTKGLVFHKIQEVAAQGLSGLFSPSA